MKLLQQPISSLDILRITRQQEEIDQKVSAQDKLRSGNCTALVTVSERHLDRQTYIFPRSLLVPPQ